MKIKIVFVLILLCMVAVPCASEDNPYLSCDKLNYKSGDNVVISYRFLESSQQNSIHRVSLYRDPELYLHVKSWDVISRGSVIWNTSGALNGEYYVVLKEHYRIIGNPRGRDVILAATKISVSQGYKEKGSFLLKLSKIKKKVFKTTNYVISDFAYTYLKDDIEKQKGDLGAIGI